MKHQRPTADIQSLCEVTTCKGRMRDCPHVIIDANGLIRKICSLLQDFRVSEHIGGAVTGKILPHHRLRVAISACPNACSRPQIRDVGIIAQSVPEVVDDGVSCTGCGVCVDVCREQAIGLDAAGPRIDREICVNCGNCTAVCATRAIVPREQGWRLLVGGRLGRHPHLAEELLALGSEDEVMQALRVCLGSFVSGGNQGERFADFVSRTGVDILRHAVLENLALVDKQAAGRNTN